MFDFEKLEVYTHVRRIVKKVLSFIYSKKDIDPILSDQLKRGVTSILFNLSEGTGRMSAADKKHFYTIARSSAFECVSILHVLSDLDHLSQDQYDDFYDDLETISKMLLGMIRSFSR